MVSRKKSRKASRKRRSSKPKKIGYYVKNGKVLIAYEGHNRQGKLVHKDSAGKTIRKTVKIHKLKRDANKHAKSKKGRKASRKSSRKRKSAKRKASRKRKSKFRNGHKSSSSSCGFSAGKKKRKYRQKKKKRRRKKAWSSKAPMTRSSRMKLYRRDPSCFLLPPMHGEMPKYPICDKKGKKLCEGVLSAKMRADLVKNTHGRYSNKRARKSARRVSRKAVKIARDHGCRKMASLYRRHH